MDARPHHLYVVDDDADTRDLVAQYLERQGFAVTTMASAEELLRRMHRLRPDLIVLDVNLPGMTGLDACQRLRADGDRVPIILLTGLSEEIDRVVGLEVGADDYLAKPFSARELLARIRAVLRRAVVVPGLPPPEAPEVRLGDRVFQPTSRSLVQANGDVRVLSTVEFAMLNELTANPNVPVSRERLLAVSHARGGELLSRTVDVAMMRLRKLVEPDPGTPRYLQTVRGHGYMFVPTRH